VIYNEVWLRRGWLDLLYRVGKLISGSFQYRVGKFQVRSRDILYCVGIPMSYVVLFNLGKMRSDYIQLRGGLVSSRFMRYSLGEIKSGVVCSG
jgi:hypothetical protein